MQAELRSEDTDCPSILRIKSIADKTLPGKDNEQQQWQVFSIELISGKRTVLTLPDEEVMLCRHPSDEIALLAQQLQELLDGSRDEVLFEPSEPSFEMTIARTRRGGIKVETWLDAGNGTTGIYTWDASGTRFMTTPENLADFVAQLRS